MAQPDMESRERIILSSDDTAKISLSLRLSAGREGQRLEYDIDLDEAREEISMHFLDELAERSERRKGQLSGSLLQNIRGILQGGKIPASFSQDEAIVPGSIAGLLSLRIGDEQYAFRFAVPDDFEKSGFISTDTAFTRTEGGKETERLMQMIATEAKQAGKV